jgi:hypothetical protein
MKLRYFVVIQIREFGARMAWSKRIPNIALCIAMQTRPAARPRDQNQQQQSAATPHLNPLPKSARGEEATSAEATISLPS